MNNGLFQPVDFPMLDPNGTTNGIPNSIINESRKRANQGLPAVPQQPKPSEGQISPEELRAQTGRLQSYDMNTQYPKGPPQFTGTQMPQPGDAMSGGDMSVMNTNPNMPADMPTVEGTVPQQEVPSYVGNPVLDKYIHTFIGGA